MIRSGWVFSGVSPAEVESVADHSYMVSLLTMIIALVEQQAGHEIDLGKALMMAIIHDLSESVSQDIDRRVEKFAPAEFQAFKKKLDENALSYLLEKLPGETPKKLQAIFEEYQQRKTREAIIVAEVDRLETILQLREYIRNSKGKENFKEFNSNFALEKDKFQIPLIKSLARALLEEKKEHDR